MVITNPDRRAIDRTSTDAVPSTEDELLRILLTLDQGWASDLQLSWEIGSDSLDARRQVRRLLSGIGRSGVLERIFVRHNGGEPLAITRVDHPAIRETLGEDR